MSHAILSHSALPIIFTTAVVALLGDACAFDRRHDDRARQPAKDRSLALYSRLGRRPTLEPLSLGQYQLLIIPTTVDP
jgi:hypothetical protein